MVKGLMFGFVTKTSNPIGGSYRDTAAMDPLDLRHCVHGCCYCYAREIKESHPEWEKYHGPYRLVEKELKEYPDGSVVFIQDMGDIGDPNIPSEVTGRIFCYITDHPKVDYLLLTKNPHFYEDKLDIMADLPNIIFGVTVETNNFISEKISRAPSPMTRVLTMIRLHRRLPEARILVSVEPILDFHLDSLVSMIVRLKPYLVAVGYDNHPENHPNMKLPEPSLEKTMRLIETLENRNVKVHRKTLREARI